MVMVGSFLLASSLPSVVMVLRAAEAAKIPPKDRWKRVMAQWYPKGPLSGTQRKSAVTARALQLLNYYRRARRMVVWSHSGALPAGLLALGQAVIVHGLSSVWTMTRTSVSTGQKKSSVVLSSQGGGAEGRVVLTPWWFPWKSTSTRMVATKHTLQSHCTFGLQDSLGMACQRRRRRRSLSQWHCKQAAYGVQISMEFTLRNCTAPSTRKASSVFTRSRLLFGRSLLIFERSQGRDD